MEYSVYRQAPEGSNFPKTDEPWELIGTFESDRDLRHVSIDYALKMVNEPRKQGVWHMVLPVERSGKKPEIWFN